MRTKKIAIKVVEEFQHLGYKLRFIPVNVPGYRYKVVIADSKFYVLYIDWSKRSKGKRAATHFFKKHLPEYQ